MIRFCFENSLWVLKVVFSLTCQVAFIQLGDLILGHVPRGRSDSLWLRRGMRPRSDFLCYQRSGLNSSTLPQLNILTCGLIGSYSVVLAFDSYLYTSLSHIALNVLKRALSMDFHIAFTKAPFQTNGKTKSKNRSDSQVGLLACLCQPGHLVTWLKQKDSPAPQMLLEPSVHGNEGSQEEIISNCKVIEVHTSQNLSELLRNFSTRIT